MASVPRSPRPVAVVLAEAVAAAMRLVAAVAALVAVALAAETADADPALAEFSAVPDPLLTAAAEQ